MTLQELKDKFDANMRALMPFTNKHDAYVKAFEAMDASIPENMSYCVLAFVKNGLFYDVQIEITNKYGVSFLFTSALAQLEVMRFDHLTHPVYVI